MRLRLQDLREHFADRQGDGISALSVSALAVLLMGLAHLTHNAIIAIVAVVNTIFVWVPLGELLQQRRAEQRWRALGVDAELLDELEALAKINPSLDEYVDSVLAVYMTIWELANQNAWFRQSADFASTIGQVRESMTTFFARVRRADELRAVYSMTAKSLRSAARLADLRARVAREYDALGALSDAFENALLAFSEAMAASMASDSHRLAAMPLEEFARTMRRLTASLDEMEAQREQARSETEAATLEDEAAEWERMLGADADDADDTVRTARHSGPTE